MDPYKTIPILNNGKTAEFGYTIDNQDPQVLISGRINLFTLDHDNNNNEKNVGILIDLKGSHVSAVKGIDQDRSYDEDDDQGYFTESIMISAYLEDENNNNLTLFTSSPPTIDSRKSFSSSINADAGFFGVTPTGNIGISSSYNQSVDDFEVSNASDSKVMVHKYHLAAYVGGQYNPGDPSAMVDHTALVAATVADHSTNGLLGFVGRATGVLPKWTPMKIVGNPTDSSIHNYDIFSQGLFQTKFEPAASLKLTINFKAVWRRVFIDWHEILNNPTVPTSDSESFTRSESFIVEFNL